MAATRSHGAAGPTRGRSRRLSERRSPYPEFPERAGRARPRRGRESLARCRLPGAILGGDDLGQLLGRGFLGRLVERDTPVLEQIDAVADLDDVDVVVRHD